MIGIGPIKGYSFAPSCSLSCKLSGNELEAKIERHKTPVTADNFKCFDL